MRIVFVRHGEPNYSLDCLTETGHRQAEAVSRRLVTEGISEIYASPMGRAQETAAYTAKRLNLSIRTLPFMHEIRWGDRNGDGKGYISSPWVSAELMVRLDDFDFQHNDWRNHPEFSNNKATDCYDMIVEKSDVWMASMGYTRQGTRYFCEASENKTIALFSHGGSSTAFLSHLFNMPFAYACATLSFGFTSVTIARLPHKPGEIVVPQLELFADDEHLKSEYQTPDYEM